MCTGVRPSTCSPLVATKEVLPRVRIFCTCPYVHEQLNRGKRIPSLLPWGGMVGPLSPLAFVSASLFGRPGNQYGGVFSIPSRISSCDPTWLRGECKVGLLMHCSHVTALVRRSTDTNPSYGLYGGVLETWLRFQVSLADFFTQPWSNYSIYLLRTIHRFLSPPLSFLNLISRGYGHVRRTLTGSTDKTSQKPIPTQPCTGG